MDSTQNDHSPRWGSCSLSLSNSILLTCVRHVCLKAHAHLFCGSILHLCTTVIVVCGRSVYCTCRTPRFSSYTSNSGRITLPRHVSSFRSYLLLSPLYDRRDGRLPRPSLRGWRPGLVQATVRLRCCEVGGFLLLNSSADKCHDQTAINPKVRTKPPFISSCSRLWLSTILQARTSTDMAAHTYFTTCSLLLECACGN